MKKGPMVEEIRKNREKWAAKFNFDLLAIGADAKKRQEKSTHPVVSLISRNKKTASPLCGDQHGLASNRNDGKTQTPLQRRKDLPQGLPDD